MSYGKTYLAKRRSDSKRLLVGCAIGGTLFCVALILLGLHWWPLFPGMNRVMTLVTAGMDKSVPDPDYEIVDWKQKDVQGSTFVLVRYRFRLLGGWGMDETFFEVHDGKIVVKEQDAASYYYSHVDPVHIRRQKQFEDPFVQDLQDLLSQPE